VFSIDDLHADAVILATGVRERPRSARLVPGDRPAGIFTTGSVQQLAMAGHRVGNRAVIVGAEHVSFSAILTLAHAGCRSVAMVTPLPRHQSYAVVKLATASLRRVPVLTGVDVAEIVGRRHVEHVVLTDGRKIECDTVVFTGDWIPDNELARRSGLHMDPTIKGPVVDRAFRTSRDGVFAIGNLVHHVAAADRCALDGRAVAAEVVGFIRR
jgi:NAD(P)H-nitrite reductase large subunit